MDNAILQNTIMNVGPWVGIAILLILGLPLPRVSKLILEISALLLRVLLLVTLAGGVYLWFRPESTPVDWISNYQGLSPQAQSLIPAPGTPMFGLVLAGILTLSYLPALAVLDVTRKLAGARLRRLRRLTAEDVDLVKAPATMEMLVTPESHHRKRVVAVRGSSLHTAADKIASVNNPQMTHNRVADYVK
jgi:hypothetical protein